DSVGGESADGAELAVAAAVGPPLALEFAVDGELLHHVAELIGYVHVALTVHRHRLGEAQHALGALADDLHGRVRARPQARAGAGFRERRLRAGCGPRRDQCEGQQRRRTVSGEKAPSPRDTHRTMETPLGAARRGSLPLTAPTARASAARRGPDQPTRSGARAGSPARSTGAGRPAGRRA